MAGISAGKHLTDLGESDFLILEASDRLGGRMKSRQFGAYTVGGGAQWISGGGPGDPIWELAVKYNVSFVESDYDDYIARNMTGHDVTEEADARYESFDAALAYVGELSGRLGSGNHNFSWYDTNVNAALIRGGWFPKDHLDEAIQWWDVDFVFSKPKEEVSVRGFGVSFYEWPHSEYLVTEQENGFEKIVIKLSEEFLVENDERLILNSRVVRIVYAGDEVQVETDDGRVYFGDHVICTFSLGVLKNPNSLTFDPPLPEWKLDAIANFDTTYYSAIYVKFDVSFWDPVEWILVASDRRGYFPVIQNFDKNYPDSHILQLTAVAGESIRLSRLSKDEIKEEIQAYLRAIYGSNTPDIVDIAVPDWQTNPLYLGSYSEWAVGLTESTYNALKASLGRLHFAGEAYDEDWYGYVNGAYHSGARQANYVMECINDPGRCVQYKLPQQKVGCTYEQAVNHDINAEYDDGSCEFAKRSGSKQQAPPS